MKYLTATEATAWCKTHGIPLDAQGAPEQLVPGPTTKIWNVPAQSSKVVSLARRLEHLLAPWSGVLFWPTAWSIWPSSENWHIYYRLRQSYGDFRLIDEAPGHLFLESEAGDLVSFLQLGITFGWDIHVIDDERRLRIFLSHDEWVAISSNDEAEISGIEFGP
jgi:hypothetical protein